MGEENIDHIHVPCKVYMNGNFDENIPRLTLILTLLLGEKFFLLD